MGRPGDHSWPVRDPRIADRNGRNPSVADACASSSWAAHGRGRVITAGVRGAKSERRSYAVEALAKLQERSGER